MWGFHEGMGWWMVFGGLWTIVFWVAVVGTIVWVVNRLSGGGAERRDGADSPLDILKRRLARGEITEGEYEKLKEALR